MGPKWRKWRKIYQMRKTDINRDKTRKEGPMEENRQMRKWNTQRKIAKYGDK